MTYLNHVRNMGAQWLRAVLVVGGLSACHHTQGTDVLDAGTDDAAVESDAGAFHTATHAPLPQLQMHEGGVVLAHPAITIATMAGDPNTDAAIAFGQWIATSAWLSTVGADYGVHAGTYVGHATVVAPANVTQNYDDYAAWVTSQLTSGALPAPASADALYVMFMPEGFGGDSTCDFGQGFHSETTFNGAAVPYAVIFNCNTAMQPYPFAFMEEAASHEVIEAATDPFPSTRPGYINEDMTSPWSVMGEVGDLCGSEMLRVDGHLVQRTYSNTAAAAGGDPCLPEDPSTGPYFSVDLSPLTRELAAPGSTVHYSLTSWSSAPTSDWMLYIQPISNDANATAVLSSMTTNNGGTATFDVTIPATAMSGTSYLGWVGTYQGRTLKGQMPFLVVVP